LELTQTSANVAFPNTTGGPANCQTTGSLGPVFSAQYNGTVNGTNNNQMSWTSTNSNQGQGYDGSGNVTYDGVHQYLYDGEGRICEVLNTVVGVTTAYLYDADGRRVAKGSATWGSCDPSTTGNSFQASSDFVLGLSGEQVTEVNVSNNVPTGVAHTNAWAGGMLLATYDVDGLHFYLTDPLGTRRAQTDYAGTREQTCQSLSFGDYETCIPAPTEHLFTGKERDTESGNDYFGARYYGSSMGRWMSPDWSASPVGLPYGDIQDPQSLNLYAYVLNNPLKNRDPDGHSCDPDTWDPKTNTLTAGACHLDWWDLPGHAFVGLGNLMMARTGKQAAKGAGQMLYAYSIGVPLAGVGVGMSAAGGLTTLGLGTAAAGGTVQGLYGAVSVAALQQAATSGGETITVVTSLDSAPVAGRALSVATGDGAEALAGQASGSTQFTAQIPKALVNLMEQTGLATRSYTAMGNATAQEIRFTPQATQFITQFFK
jgi:RHS repeat-associated protein